MVTIGYVPWFILCVLQLHLNLVKIFLIYLGHPIIHRLQSLDLHSTQYKSNGYGVMGEKPRAKVKVFEVTMAKRFNYDEMNTWTQVLEKMKLIEERLQNITENEEEQEVAEDLQHRKDTKAIVRQVCNKSKSKPRTITLAEQIIINRAQRRAIEAERRTVSVPPPASAHMAASMSSLLSAPPGIALPGGTDDDDEEDDGMPPVVFADSPRYSREELRILRDLRKIADENANNSGNAKTDKHSNEGKDSGVESPSGLNQEQLDRLCEGDYDTELDKIIKQTN